jgi:predicted permease
MSLLDGLRHRFHVLARREHYADEIAREAQFHLELESLARSPNAVSGPDTEGAARKAFGNATYYREEVRRMTPLVWLDRFRQDLSYAKRGLGRSPGFTLAVVVTLGLGIGLNAALFSLLDQIFDRAPAGVASPGELRRLYMRLDHAVSTRGSHVARFFSYRDFAGIADAFAPNEVAIYTSGDSVSLAEARTVAKLSYVSGNYFSLLGVRPEAGRFFDSAESRIDNPNRVLVISHALWERAFGSDQGVIGRRVQLNGQLYTIIGVAGQDFTGLDWDRVDVWTPASNLEGVSYDGKPWYVGRSGNYFSTIARLQGGTSEAVLVQKGAARIRALRSVASRPDTSTTIMLGPIIEARGPAEQASELSISTRLAAVGIIVLLIACANVTNLLLLRMSRRRREIAIRHALGVSHGRLYEQVLLETLLLAGLSALAALMLAAWGSSALRHLLFPRIHWASAVMNGRVLTFLAVTALATGLVCGIGPATASSSPSLMNAIRAGSLESAYRGSRLRSTLVVAQAALCVVLLVGAGLFIRSLQNVQNIDIGYDAQEIAFAQVSAVKKDAVAGAQAALDQIATAMRSVPGVRSASLASLAPMMGLEGFRVYRRGADSVLHFGKEYPSKTGVSPDYFATVGIRVLAGRGITPGDRLGGEPVMVVSSRLARMTWPGQLAVGQCLVLRNETDPCTRVVGVVEDVHTMSILGDAGLLYYIPLAQDTLNRPLAIVVRATPARLGAVAAELRRRIAAAVPSTSSVLVETLSQRLEPELRPWMLGARLFGAFGLLALIVAAVGIYSVVSYTLSQRTREMGIRIALGARGWHILGLVVEGGIGTLAIGIVIGSAIAFVMARFVASLLFGVSTTDPTTLIAAIVILACIGIAASVIPGWRATRVDPMTVLRTD